MQAAGRSLPANLLPACLTFVSLWPGDAAAGPTNRKRKKKMMKQ
jgi:hypothetical protein